MSTKRSSTPRIAIFYDWLNQWGGAEKVLLDILKIYPQASLFTLVHDPTSTKWLSTNLLVTTSFINRLPNALSNPIYYTPLYPLALEQFNFANFDIIISTTSTVGHCLLTPPSSLYVCYFHNINRYLYQTPSQFKFLKPILNLYKKIDQIYSQRPDYLLCNSHVVQNRIQKHYHRQATIINPGIDLNIFRPSPTKSKNDPYFLVVSRLVAHKKFDIAIKACLKLGLHLKIAGTGRNQQTLQSISRNSPLIEFLGSVDQSTLVNLYQNCQALICPQLEDYGLTALEVQACGRPVIAFNRGGHTETIIANKTGLFFNHQTVKSLSFALKKFRSDSFSSANCVLQAQKFSDQSFMLNFQQRIDQLWQKHQNTFS